MTANHWSEFSPLVNKAYEFAKQAHHGQKRVSGSPYLDHVEKTAEIVAGWGLDEITVSAAFLHDVVEDTSVTLDQIKNEFGKEIAFLVNGVTKLGHVKYRGSITEMENMRKFILAVSEDIRVILIKLADRLHNMRTLIPLPLSKQKRIASETLEIYAPLAYRLGMFELSGELEDISFSCLYQKDFNWLKENVRERYQARENYVKRIVPFIEEELKKHQVDLIRINSRAKRYWSLYKKLQRYDMDLDQIYDLVAVRCIVKTIEDCYAALGAVHGRWLPLPNKIKDYIAMPKANGYQSLHTTIFGPEKKMIEVQIRTQEMHDEAEFGIAAHWAYHQSKKTDDYLKRKAVFADQKELLWVKQLQAWQENLHRPREFMKSLKTDFLEDRVLVLTPKGGVIELPENSTPVDFAYKVHSDIGNSCVGARVNGVIVPLNTKLKTGDVVEIITQKNKKPSELWLNFVKTTQAKNYIKNVMRQRHHRLVAPDPDKVEFKILVEDRIGILKDITAAISRSHVNIIDHHSSHRTNLGDKFHLIKISCSVTDRKKAEKLSEKLKKIKSVKKIDFRLV